MSMGIDPFGEFRRAQQEMDRAFNQVWGGRSDYPRLTAPGEQGGQLTTRPEGQATWWPSVDVKETKDKILVHAELPGLRKEDININVDNGMLQISGERKAEKKEENERWHRVERSYGSFYRSFRLPEEAVADKITARCDNGVLTVEVPKTARPERPQAKRITVQ